MLLGALALPGCVRVFALRKEADRTCEHDFLAYTGGLTFHVLQGNGDGGFDYAPEAAHVDRIAGELDLGTGAFAWDVSYGSGVRVVDHVEEGVGTIWRDGDLDLVWTEGGERTDGRSVSTGVRTLRLGCDEETRFEDVASGDVSYEVRTYEADGYALERQLWYRGTFVSAVGRGLPDGSSSLEMAWDVEPFALSFTETDDGDGTVRRTFDDREGDTRLAGWWERGADGTRYEYAVTTPGLPDQGWAYAIGLDGTGAGTVTYGASDSCALVLDASGCRREGCTNGFDGACFPPVERQ